MCACCLHVCVLFACVLAWHMSRVGGQQATIGVVDGGGQGWGQRPRLLNYALQFPAKLDEGLVGGDGVAAANEEAGLGHIASVT